ncbi:hypothetical protein ABPG72_006976 [Tetrahymena utriculariae]
MYLRQFLLENYNYIKELDEKNKVPQIQREIFKTKGVKVKQWKLYEILSDGLIRKDKPGRQRIIEVGWHEEFRHINSFSQFCDCVDDYLKEKNVCLTRKQLRYHYREHKKIIKNIHQRSQQEQLQAQMNFL